MKFYGVEESRISVIYQPVQKLFYSPIPPEEARIIAEKNVECLPQDYLLVSESGISSPETVRQLRQAGFRGFLIGETFMRTTDPGLALHAFIQKVSQP